MTDETSTPGGDSPPPASSPRSSPSPRVEAGGANIDEPWDGAVVAVWPPKPNTLKARVTVQHMVVHQSLDGDTTELVRYGGSVDLRTDEIPYTRPVRVGGEEAPLNLGWLEGKPVGSLSLQNLEVASKGFVPTPEQRAEIAARVVEVRCGGVLFALLLPGDPPMVLHPADAFTLRCRSGEARVKVGATPGD